VTVRGLVTGRALAVRGFSLGRYTAGCNKASFSACRTWQLQELVRGGARKEKGAQMPLRSAGAIAVGAGFLSHGALWEAAGERVQESRGTYR